jgi:hypothetical protein
MSVMLELPQEVETALAARAEREGVAVPQLITQLLQQGLAVYDGDGDPDGNPLALARAISQIRNRSQAEHDENQRRVLAGARQACPVPHGKSLTDIVVGKWPGTETDQEISQILEELS